MIVVHTSPGSASLIARFLDYRHKETEILGTVAGDDTIFIVPKSIKRIHHTLKEVEALFFV
jgi:transcriptional regulator of arginine metabolism